MDNVDILTRSKMMANIRSKNTIPELTVRRYLHSRGLRFRLHRKDLPGNPDIVMPKFMTCIFVHGCFWHRHPQCRFATTPATRVNFWTEKFAKNVARDLRNIYALEQLGWKVLIIWECQLRNEPAALEALEAQVRGSAASC